MVTSDSLAAESIQEGGSFGANSDARGRSAQPSYSTTTNTTDVSGATRLEPAPDAEARQASEEWSESSQLNAGAELGKESGVGPTYNTGGTLGGGSSGVSDTTNQPYTSAATSETAAAAPGTFPKDKPLPVPIMDAATASTILCLARLDVFETSLHDLRQVLTL